MADVFLYADPFVGDVSSDFSHFYLLDSLTDDNRQEEQRFHNLLLKFALQYGLIVSDGVDISKAYTDNMGSFLWIIHVTNMRSLVDSRQYAMVMSSLRSDGGKYLQAVLDLHVRIGCLFDKKLLNTLCHRTMTSIGLIPTEVADERERVDWLTIHRETPFLWLIILLQVVIRTELNVIE